jgi:acetamidase/formamidase
MPDSVGKPTQIVTASAIGFGPHGGLDRTSNQIPPGGREETGFIAASLRVVTHQWMQPEREAAVALIEGGVDRTDLRRASALVSAGAVIPGWLASPGIVAAAAGRGDAPVLHSGVGRVEGRYLRSTLETARWGALPDAGSVPAATVESGAVVTVDTISHEGILEDQGRDPVAYFGRYGIARERVLDDARALAASDREHDGPCVVSGPIAVRGAEPGDVLRVDVLGLVPRVPYGVVSNRHAGGGAHAVTMFTPVRRADDGYRGYLPVSRQLRAEFPLDPYMGIMGVAGDELTFSDGLGVGSSLFLPVRVPGAKFFTGDPHYVREGAFALEAPLRATFRLTVVGAGATATPEVAPYWVARARLDEPTRRSIEESLAYLAGELGMPRALAFAHLGAAGRLL